MIELFKSGGMIMLPLLFFSLVVWGVLLERLWVYYRLARNLKEFHLESMQYLLKADWEALKKHCDKNPEMPLAEILLKTLERLNSKDPKFKTSWFEAMERARSQANYQLKKFLWILGTVGSSAPFIGLFGTVVGILKSFQEMAKSGSGGFNVVAAGISESLVATAAGILVAVIAVLGFNILQTQCQNLILQIRNCIEEVAEIIDMQESSKE